MGAAAQDSGGGAALASKIQSLLDLNFDEISLLLANS